MVSHMAMTASYVERPDRTYSTGVISPFSAIRQAGGPVEFARQVIGPFQNLGDGSDQAMAAARQARGQAPVVNPQAVQTSNRNVTATVITPAVPDYLQYLNRAARAGQIVDRAQSQGSVGDIIRAKQRQLRMLGVKF